MNILSIIIVVVVCYLTSGLTVGAFLFIYLFQAELMAGRMEVDLKRLAVYLAVMMFIGVPSLLALISICSFVRKKEVEAMEEMERVKYHV